MIMITQRTQCVILLVSYCEIRVILLIVSNEDKGTGPKSHSQKMLETHPHFPESKVLSDYFVCTLKIRRLLGFLEASSLFSTHFAHSPLAT